MLCFDILIFSTKIIYFARKSFKITKQKDEHYFRIYRPILRTPMLKSINSSNKNTK